MNGEVENIIISALSQAFSEYDVESFPSNFESYTFTSSVGCLLVKYVKTEYKTQNTIWNVNQESTVNFSVIAGFRGLNKYCEIHEPMQRIKDVLTGLEIAGRKVYLVNDSFIAEINTDLFCGISLKIDLWQEER